MTPTFLATVLRVATGRPFAAVGAEARAGGVAVRERIGGGYNVAFSGIPDGHFSIAKSIDEIAALLAAAEAPDDVIAKSIDQRLGQRLSGRGARVERGTVHDEDGWLVYDLVGVGKARVRHDGDGRFEAAFTPDDPTMLDEEAQKGLLADDVADWIAWRAVAPKLKTGGGA